MTFYDVLTYFKNLPNKDLFVLLDELEGGILFLASKWHCPAVLFYVFGLALALVLGCLAYRWIKPSIFVANAVFGILVGSAVFYALWSVLPKLPAWLCYLFCFVVATIFVCVPLKNPRLALSLYSAICAYVVMGFYVPSVAICLGFAFVIAALTFLIPRVIYVLTSSAAFGILVASFLSMLIPKIPSFRAGWVAWVLAFAFAVIFLHVQFLTTKEKQYL